MEKIVRDDSVTIRLFERIGEMDAALALDEMSLALEDAGDRNIIMDCTGLKYISSSGLRSLLTIQKKHKKQIRLINVRGEIKSILDTTGFTEIFDVRPVLRTVNLDELEKIGDGINGSLYSMGKGIMVKAYHSDVTWDDIETEKEMAKKSLVLGIPTAISFSEVRCDDGYGILFERINGESLAKKLQESPEMCRKYAGLFADLVKELHQTVVADGTLPNIKNRYHEWLSKTKDKIDEGDWKKMSALIDAMSDCNTYVHGDINLTNVFLVDDELMLMDMSSCGYGHPIFDLQAIYASLIEMENIHHGYCEETFGLDSELCREFWRHFINAYTGDVSGDTSDRIITEDDLSVNIINFSRLNTLLNEYCVLKERLLSAL